MNGLEQLEATPAMLRLLFAQLSEQEAAWKPSPARFSAAQVLAHLISTEDECYGARLKMWDREEIPRFRFAADGTLPRKIGTVAEELEQFEKLRRENLAWLERQPEEAAGRTAFHEVQGEVTLAEQVAAWSVHDLGHIRQIAELVRAAKYYPLTGPWQSEFQLNP